MIAGEYPDTNATQSSLIVTGTLPILPLRFQNINFGIVYLYIELYVANFFFIASKLV